MIALPNVLIPVVETLIERGCRPVVVGGYVRDGLLGIPSKDIDIEVFDVESLETLALYLQPFGQLNSVGKSFGVLKLRLEKIEVDFSIARLEKKVGEGHRGFEVTLDSSLEFKEAARRRDFTINAMGFDLKEKRLLDPYGGQKDLESKLLRVVDEETFVEDPLRLYRAVQFTGRFGLRPDEAFIPLAQKMVAQKMLGALPKERVFEEIKKLLLKSERPSVGFLLMREVGMLAYFKELQDLIGVPQDPIYHPEGDVWVHTMMVIDEMSKLHGDDEKQNLLLSLAALTHDLGKANTTKVVDGRIRAIGHELTGLPLCEQFMARLSDEKAVTEALLPLVKHHLKPLQFYKQGAKSAAILRLARSVNIEQLVLLAKADFLGRTTPEAKAGRFEAGEWLLERAAALHVRREPLPPLIQGRDLVKMGLHPSKAFKAILERAYEAQIEGLFKSHDEALIWLRKELA